MKDFKYFVIFGISLVLCIYVVVFMPSVDLLEDYSDELWYHEAENITEFYENGIVGVDLLNETYKGEISLGHLRGQLNLSIGLLQQIHTVYEETKESYEANKQYFYENFGIENYIEYNMLYTAIKEVYVKDANDVVDNAHIVANSIKQVDNGTLINVNVTYTSGNILTLIVLLYNKEQQPLEGVDSTNVFPTILRILPKVDG